MAPIASSDSEVKTCSNICLKNYEDLKKKYDDLLVKLDDTSFKAATYKRGLSILEGQIVKYKEHEVLFSEEIALLKRSVGHKEYQMGLLRTELEKVKLEKEGFEFKIAKFEKSAKDLDQLLASQITDKSKKGLEEFKEPKVNEEEEPKKARENTDAPIIDEWVSDDEDEVESPVVVKKKTVIPTAAKLQKPVRKPVKYAEIIKAVNTAKPKDAHNAVKRNRFNTVKASACWVWMPKNRVVDHVSKNISASVTLKRLDYIDAQGRFKWMHRLRGGKSVAKKKKNPEKREDCWELNTSELVLPRDELVLLSQQLVLLEENSSYCSRLQLPVLNQSVNTARITAVGEKVNAAESLLVVSTEVNAD
ncbi:hypothetical protein Tco_0684563 [Tanacetum coccineum]